MPCRTCRRVSKDTTHAHCRRHAACAYAEGAQYLGAPCFTCAELWQRVKDKSDPEDSLDAWKGLFEWVTGFRRNSRNRPKGQDFFARPEERSTFERWHAIMHVGSPPASQQTPPPSQAVAPAVSIFKILSFPVMVLIKNFVFAKMLLRIIDEFILIDILLKVFIVS